MDIALADPAMAATWALPGWALRLSSAGSNERAS